VILIICFFSVTFPFRLLSLNLMAANIYRVAFYLFHFRFYITVAITSGYVFNKSWKWKILLVWQRVVQGLTYQVSYFITLSLPVQYTGKQRPGNNN